MRGADALIAARRSGYRPQNGVCVLIDGLTKPNDGEELVLEVMADEPIDRLDLRCLVGLRVVAVGSNDQRVSAFVEAAKNAGAEGVVGLEFRHERGIASERWIASHNPWTAPRNTWPN